VKLAETAVVPAALTGLVDVNSGTPVHVPFEKTVNVTAPVGTGTPTAGVSVAVSWNEEPRVIAAAETRATIGVGVLLTTTFSFASPHALADGL
jgi:hypothetical protein